jgi:23S rRNA (uracil1939-C5)-methyltransferase
VAEFYAGTGAIGLSLLSQAGALRLNEAAPASLQGLALGLDRLSPEQRARTSVVPGGAGEARAMADGADVVIVDPPRKGLDAPLRDRLASSPPARLFYVSCELSSLMADAAALTTGGALRLVGLTAFDQMPYTDHVETLAEFSAPF